MKKEKKEIVKGYKAFDEGLKCRGFQYELGKDYTHEGDIELCASGFHFCRNLADVYSYYPLGAVVAEIEAFGDVLDEDGGNKSVTNGLRIVRILAAESEARANLGRENSGYLNTGNWNTGNWNTGNRNTGNWNTGDLNTGNWNTGNLNTGFFNTVTPEEVLVFNKKCKRSKWNEADKPYFMWIDTLRWVEFSGMSDEEKEKNPGAKTTGGYLKKLSYHEAWKDAWNKASATDRKKVEKLPNFDRKIFKEITGIDVKND